MLNIQLSTYYIKPLDLQLRYESYTVISELGQRVKISLIATRVS